MALKESSNAPAPSVYEFGPYRLESATRRLSRNGEPVGLTPKAFDILLVLIERRGRVVDKSELMRLVWPDSFVEEANLSQTVFVLRKTLGEDDSGRQFIDTVPRRGYRFAAEVRLPGEFPPEGQTAGAGKTRMWVAAAVASTALLVGIAAWVRARPDVTSSDPQAGMSRVAVLPFENLTNNRADDWLSAAFSESMTSALQDVETLIPVSRDRIVELYRRHGILDASALDAGALRRVTEVLGVRYVVHGSYQKLGDRIKVSARLVAADTGAIEAQESVSDDFANLLNVEDDLAERFARKLQVGKRATTARARPASIKAYQALIDGRTMYAQSRHHEAVAPLTRATTLDPQSAQAWALVGKNQARLATITAISSGAVDDMRRDALEYAKRAVMLAPDLYDAHVALALASRELEDFEQWRAEALRAIELGPNIAEAYELLADSYFAGNAWGCRRDRNAPLAEKYFQKALQIDPLWAAPYANLSYHFSWSGREDDALRIADQGLAGFAEQSDHHPRTRVDLGPLGTCR